MFKQILQVVNHFALYDGVSNIIRDFMTMLDGYGVKNAILSITRDPDCGINDERWHSVDKLNDMLTHETLVIFHFSFPTPLSAKIIQLSCPKVLLYHNITPPVFFEGYNEFLQGHCIEGYKEIISIAPYFEYGWGDSAYNCTQLQEAGFERTAVTYPPFDFKRLEDTLPGHTVKKKDGITSILFVGRLAPNKRQEDIIRAFYYYHRLNPNSELTLVGNSEFFDNYKQELIALAREWDLPVNITGAVSAGELVGHYKNADMFLCMSEHEGFCIPIIEAMYFGVPVVAFKSSAVTEIVGDAGIVFSQKHFPSVAHLMHTVLEDPALREKMRAAGFERVRYFSKENTAARIMQLIGDYADELNM